MDPETAGFFRSLLNQGMGTLQRILTQVHGMGSDPDVTPFWYMASTSAAISNGSTATLSLRIESDADFVWTHAVARCLYTSTKAPAIGVMGLSGSLITGGAGASWPIRARLTTSGTGRDLSSAPVPMQLMFGNGVELPFRLPRPMTFGKSTTLQIELERYGLGSVEPDGTVGSAAPATEGLDVEIAFIGVKVYSSKRVDITGR